MSKIDELIKEYCPDGVDLFKLSDISTQYSGMHGVSNKWADSGNCKFIDYMNVYKNIKTKTNDFKYATVQSLSQNTAQYGDVLFTSASETPDECALSSVIQDEVESGVFIDDHLFAIRINIDFKDKIIPGYMKYVFRSSHFRSEVLKVVRGVTRFYVAKKDFMKLTIPVPPCEVQKEIVRILDNFSEYVTSISEGLPAEIEARKKQYEYYRNKLLTF